MKLWKFHLAALFILASGYAWAQEAIDGSVSGTTGVQVMGTDGTNAQIIKTDTGGAVQIDCESGCGGGTQYAEDTAHASGDQATMAGVVQQSADTALSNDGDRSFLQVDANGYLKVNIKAGAGSGGTAAADDSAFTLGTTNVTVAGCIEATDTMDAGDLGGIKCGSDRELDIDVMSVPAPLSTTGGGTEAAALRVTVANDSTGVLSVDDNGGSLTVDGTVTANAGSGTFTVGQATSSNLNAEVEGQAANDAAVSGNPVLVAGRASAAAPADVSADGDAVSAWRLRNGAAATVITAAGALVGGDATNGLDVDVTRLPALVAGTANIGDVDVLTVPAPLSTTGGGTEATALRVTLANDSTGLVSIDDNGGSLTIDAPVGTPANVQIGDASETATVRDTGTSDSLNVAIVDASGNQITSFGGGTEYTEDAASAADPVGNQAMARRRDTLSSETTTDGDVTALNATAKGELYVKHVDAIPVTDNAGSLTVDGTLAATQSGTWNITNISGTVSLPTGAATLAEQQTQTTALQLIDNLPRNEDTASADADTGVMILARRTATPANTSGADLDYESLQMSAGRLWTSAVLEAGTANIGDVDVLTFPDNEPINIAQMNGVAVTMGNGVAGTGVQRVTIASDSTGEVNQDTASAFNAEVQGDAAHDAAAAGNPVLVGVEVETPDDSAPSGQVSAEGDVTNLQATRDGVLYTAPWGSQRIWESSAEYTSQQTDTSLKAAAGAGLSHYVTSVFVSCNAAATVTLEDDEGTDDLIFRHYCDAAGSGAAMQFNPPIKNGANQALLLTTSAAVTLTVVVSGFTAP